ncbi:MAG: FKBP-type peptidyl-prolyl cis-trans isomerase [Oceanococcus sp.]
MNIAQDCVVSLDYTLKNDAGETLDSSTGGEPLTYLHGHGNLIRGLEKALDGRQASDSFEVSIAPEDGYGMPNDQLVQTVPRSAFEGIDTIEPGMRFQTGSDTGPMVVSVTEVTEDSVTIDGNHDLAGETLNFSVTVTDVRTATAQELEHGHVHSGGHDH